MDSIVTKSAYYYIKGVDLKKEIRDNPDFNAVRADIGYLVDQYKEALANKPDTLNMLNPCMVPDPPIDNHVRGCRSCSYTRVIDSVCVEWSTWGGNEEYDDCGLQIKSYSIVENGVTTKNVIEAWGMIQRPW